MRWVLRVYIRVYARLIRRSTPKEKQECVPSVLSCLRYDQEGKESCSILAEISESVDLMYEVDRRVVV